MTIWGKQHPDLTPEGDGRADLHIPAAERDFDRSYAANYQQAVAQIARRQAELPVEIQRHVQGRNFPAPTAAEGLRLYEAELEWAKTAYAMGRGFEKFITDQDVSDMSLEQYNENFLDSGQPRPGVLLWRTSRSQVLDDGLDSASQGELRNLGRSA
jgi:hypothetical protein